MLGMSEVAPPGREEPFVQINYEQSYRDDAVRLGTFERDDTIMDYLQMATYELGDKYMSVSDPVWGVELIGDKPYDDLLLQLARTPVFRRLQSIEQLTLGPEHATMPNSMYFSRWQHIWGSLVFVRKMTEDDPRFDDRQKIVLQLRTLLSDVGHTAFSHLGDWLFQGIDGGEDLHDQDLKDLLKVTGVEETLESYGLTVKETVFPDTDDWVECSSPDLCVDRVDYGMREILRWASPPIPLDIFRGALKDPKNIFEITNDGQLAFKSETMARWYAVGFSLLPTEHWSHPVHRLQLQLFQGAVRSSTIERSVENNIHPREALYAIDASFMGHFQTWEMMHLQKIMKDVAATQRRIFVSARKVDLERVFRGIEDEDWQYPAFPDPLKSYTWQSDMYGKPYSPQLDIRMTRNTQNSTNFTANRRGLVVHLPALKARAVDPPIVTSTGDIVRLSQAEPGYRTYLAQQRSMMARAYDATVLMRPDVAQKIVLGHEEGSKEWQRVLQKPRSNDALNWVIGDIQYLAAALHLDVIHEADDQDIQERALAWGKLVVKGSNLTAEQ
jgi:uncharacterized protein